MEKLSENLEEKLKQLEKYLQEDFRVHLEMRKWVQEHPKEYDKLSSVSRLDYVINLNNSLASKAGGVVVILHSLFPQLKPRDDPNQLYFDFYEKTS